MKQIDLDDLPPKLARLMGGLEAGETLTLVQHGLVVGRLALVDNASPPAEDDGLTQDERMSEVLDHFASMINDKF